MVVMQSKFCTNHDTTNASQPAVLHRWCGIYLLKKSNGWQFKDLQLPFILIKIIHMIMIIIITSTITLVYILETSQYWNRKFLVNYLYTMYTSHYRADSRFAPSQWGMALFCNDIPHWLRANLESALYCMDKSFHENFLETSTKTTYLIVGIYSFSIIKYRKYLLLPYSIYLMESLHK